MNSKELKSKPNFLLKSCLAVILLSAIMLCAFYAYTSFAEEAGQQNKGLETDRQDRVVDNPYFDLEKRIVNQHDSDLFTVKSKQPSYWRMVGLDTYINQNGNGQDISVWQINIGPEDKMPTKLIQPKNSLGTPVEHSVNIQSLDIPDISGRPMSTNVWIPAALSPTRILQNNGAKLTIDDITQTIIIDNDDESSSYTYTVLSQIPDYTSKQLREASQNLKADFNRDELFLNLPEKSLPESVKANAQQVVGNETNRYNQMIALQSFFQEFNYAIDLEDPAPGQDPLDHFLETRIGFSQQFSSTFALMARELGVPARVAIGFTPGDQTDVAEDGTVTYQVKGNTPTHGQKFGSETNWDGCPLSQPRAVLYQAARLI